MLDQYQNGSARKTTSRVRVTYYESKRPLSVSSSDVSDTSGRRSPSTQGRVTTHAGHMPSMRNGASVDAGWENPFRPGGELSKEADQIVRAIQCGRPLSAGVSGNDVADGTAPQPPPAKPNGAQLTPADAAQLPSSPPARQEWPPPPATALAEQAPGTVEVRHSLVKPQTATQVKLVAINKKSRRGCCLVQ